MPSNGWDIQSAIEQVAKCGFECEAGSIDNNAAWDWLSKPRQKFFVNQTVYTEVEGDLVGHRIMAWRPYTVCACYLSADNDRQTYVYDLTTDPIRPWHYGSGPQIKGIAERLLSANNPEKNDDE